MRANSHRGVLGGPTVGGVEIAASPDTPARPDRWAWHVRMFDTAPDQGGPGQVEPPTSGHAPRTTELLLTTIERPNGPGFLEVRVDPSAVAPEVHRVTVNRGHTLSRDSRELLLFVVTTGEALVEDHHVLREGDAMVLTGDDPLTVAVTPPPASGDVSLVVVRLRSPHGDSIAWVP
jgi:hypothetical protein